MRDVVREKRERNWKKNPSTNTTQPPTESTTNSLFFGPNWPLSLSPHTNISSLSKIIKMKKGKLKLRRILHPPTPLSVSIVKTHQLDTSERQSWREKKFGRLRSNTKRTNTAGRLFFTLYFTTGRSPTKIFHFHMDFSVFFSFHSFFRERKSFFFLENESEFFFAASPVGWESYIKVGQQALVHFPALAHSTHPIAHIPHYSHTTDGGGLSFGRTERWGWNERRWEGKNENCEKKISLIFLVRSTRLRRWTEPKLGWWWK